MMCVEEEDEGIVRDGLAPRIAHVHRLSAKQEADGARVARTPFVIIHFLPGWIKPHDILDSQTANWSALEEFGSPKDRMLFAEADQLYNERGLRLLRCIALPVEPAELSILAIDIVDAILRPCEFIATREPRNAL